MNPNLIDRFSRIATPMARAMGSDCVDPNTNELRPESPCAKAKQRLKDGDPFWDVLVERLRAINANEAKASVDETTKTSESTPNMLDFIVNKNTTESIAIKAESMDEAEEKVSRGEGTILSRNKTLTSRPVPQQDKSSSDQQKLTAGNKPVVSTK